MCPAHLHVSSNLPPLPLSQLHIPWICSKQGLLHWYGDRVPSSHSRWRVFPLVSKGGEEDGDKPVIQLCAPQGAVRAAGKGMVEVRYTIIANGSFKTPEGYWICSTAVYIHYSPGMTTKPFSLIHTHPLVWCPGPPSQAKLNHRLSSILWWNNTYQFPQTICRRWISTQCQPALTISQRYTSRIS